MIKALILVLMADCRPSCLHTAYCYVEGQKPVRYEMKMYDCWMQPFWGNDPCGNFVTEEIEQCFPKSW